MMPALSQELLLVEVYATDQQSATGPTASFAPGTPVPGDTSGDCLPNNCSLCISFRTANRGRSFRGRNYVPGIAESNTDGSIVSAGLRTTLVAGYNGLRTLSPGGDGEWVIASRYSNGAPRSEGVLTPVTLAVSVDAVIDSQRRRLPGRGT